MYLVKNIAILLFASLTLQSHAQWAKKVEVTRVRLVYVDDKLEVTYNIGKSDDAQCYVSINFYNRDHNQLKANTLYGDIDTIVSSGPEKKIIWDIKKDYPSFNDDVYAEISAVALHNLSLRKAFFYSTLFPGSGSYQLTGSKLHLLNGVLFYGCMSASILFANQSGHNYNNYKNSYSIEERNAFYDKAANNRKLSINLLYAGTGLFILNYGITFINLKRSVKKYKQLRKVTVSVNVNNYGAPVLSYKIDF